MHNNVRLFKKLKLTAIYALSDEECSACHKPDATCEHYTKYSKTRNTSADILHIIILLTRISNLGGEVP